MQNENNLDFIFGRRSIRKYTNQPVTDEQITLILKAGMAAPSAVAKDPWRFIIVRNNETKIKIAEGLPHGKMLENANAAIVICGDISVAHDNQISYLLQDCTAAIENMLIAIHSLGLGAVWLGVHPRNERVTHLKNLFGLPENIIPVSVISLGYPVELKPSRTRYNSDFVHFEKW